jgi:protein-S-isoprenylcysteine O-methyltransferase Ste14
MENQRKDIRSYIFRYRSYTPIPFLIVMLIFAEPTVLSLVIGVITVLAGEAIRVWGVSFAGSETRTTGTVGGTFLITYGPFAHVRNPLYVGNMLLYAGVGIMSNALFPWLLIGALAWFYVQYYLIVTEEEEYLENRFGEDYRHYKRHVGRFFPRVTGYRGLRPPEKKLDLAQGLLSERRTLQAIGIVAGLIFVRYFMDRGHAS